MPSAIYVIETDEGLPLDDLRDLPMQMRDDLGADNLNSKEYRITLTLGLDQLDPNTIHQIITIIESAVGGAISSQVAERILKRLLDRVHELNRKRNEKAERPKLYGPDGKQLKFGQ